MHTPYTFPTMSARIELAWRRAVEASPDSRSPVGYDWYLKASDQCHQWSDDFPMFTGRQIAGVVAALSPRTSWDLQLKYTPIILQYAEEVCSTEGESALRTLPGPGTDANKAKAILILKGLRPEDVLKGDKVNAFFRCIIAPNTSGRVVIDVHACALAYGMDAKPPTAKRYRDAVVAFKEVAERVCWEASQVQAVTWVWWRENELERF